MRRVIWRDYAGDLNLYITPQHERELMHISTLLLRWYRNTAEYEREQMGEVKWWEGVKTTGLTYMHLKVTDKRQGMDDAVYIYECKNTTQRLVDIVDRVLVENNIVVWGGDAFINFRMAWKPAVMTKVFNTAAAVGGMKNFKLSQLAGQQMTDPGIPPGEVKYGKKLILSTEEPPMVEVTMELRTTAGDGGFKVKRGRKASPEVAVVNEIPVTPDKGDGQGHADPQPTKPTDVLMVDTPLQQAVSLEALNAVAGVLLSPPGSGGQKTATPRTTEQVHPKRRKPTPVGSPAGNLEMGGLGIGGEEGEKGTQEFLDAQEGERMELEDGEVQQLG